MKVFVRSEVLNTNMWQVTRVCTAFLALIYAVSYVSGYIVDYSDKTWPYMVVRVAQLEMERKDLVYGDKVVPKRNGLIELECNVAESSFLSSLGPELAKKVTGVKWNMPNPTMIEENRAYIKELGSREPKLQSMLVITEFNKEEDAGEYSCQLTLEDESVTKYNQKIFIPSLDGAPILKCEFECKRNTDDACQLMGEYHIKCQTYSQFTSFMRCEFHECEDESGCGPTILPPVRTGYPGDFFNRPTPLYKHKAERVKGGVATRSGVFSCDATSEEGVAGLRLFMPVTVNEVKEGLISLQVQPDPSMPSPFLPEPMKPEDLSGEYRYYDDNIREFGCWTSKDVGDFHWSFRSIGNREWSQDLHNDTLQGLTIRNFDVLDGQASVLHIRDVVMDHGGFYFCEAANPQTNTLVHRQFEISAGVWKDNANVNRKATITRHRGSSVTLRCTMRTTGSHIVTWIKTDASREIAGNVGPGPNTELSHDYEVLTIHNLTEEDSGLYQCSDTFDVNSLNGEVTLKVVDYPFDEYEQIEHLEQAVKELRKAEDDISDIVKSLAAHQDGLGTRDKDDNDSREDSSEEDSEED